MTLTNLLVPTFTQMLKTLDGLLAKALAQKPESAEMLLSARLAPDMFPLSTQIRFACVQAYEAAFRLRGEELPPTHSALLDEGRNADEYPGSLADAQKRINETIELLEGLTADALDMHASQPVVHELPNGMIFDLTAEQYARDWVLPQFYFHLMAAYSIMRSEGVEIGKADYVQHMFQYLRPETMPKG